MAAGGGYRLGDGCTLWLDGAWRHCCDAHDLAYAQLADKGVADWALFLCVAETGNPFMAFLMLVGVAIFGWWWYLRGKCRK